MRHLEWNGEPASAWLEGTIASLGSLTVKKEVAIEGHLIIYFFLSALQELVHLERCVDVAIDDFDTAWEGHISYNVVIEWHMIAQLDVDRFRHSSIMPTARCVKVGCNDKAYLERLVGLNAN